MAFWKKIIVAIIAIVLFIGIVGFLVLPAVVKPIAEEKLSQALYRPVTIGKISINPYALSVAVEGFKISEPSQSVNPFVAFDKLYVNLHGIYSILQRKLILEEINLINPYVGVTRKNDGTYNFSDLLTKNEKKPAAESKTEPFYFSFNNIQVTGGNVDFSDGPYKTKHTVRDMKLSIPVISNIDYLAKNFVQPKFSAVINGTSFELEGKTTPFLDSRESILEINIRDVDIPFYLKYVPVKMNFDLKSARLDTQLKVNFTLKKGKEPVLDISGNVALRKVILDDRQSNKILRLPELKVDIASAQPLNSDIHLSRVSLQDIELAVKRGKDGAINLQKLVDSPPADKKEPAAKEQAGKDEAKQKKPLKFVIDELQLDAANITFTDEVPAKKTIISIAPLKFKASNFSLGKDALTNIDLSLMVEKKGEITVGGKLGINPLAADLNLNVKNLGIRTFEPYFTDKVKVNVKQGSVATAGNFSLASDEKGAPRVKYAGKLYVSNLALIDESTADDFLKWKQLYFDSLQAGYNPFFLDIKGISLTDFYVQIMVNTDGTLNLQNIFGGAKKDDDKAKVVAAAEKNEKEEVKEKQEVKQDETAKNIRIGTVTFQGGTIDFADRFIKPNYSARMLNMAGSVKGLSTTESSRADVSLKGNLGYGSPIDIKGKINPLVKDLFADIKVDFRDIELSPATPYSSKFLGHPIEKGKLTFTVEYLIDKRKLDAKNNILIDQLTLGDKVDSPDAVKAPVGLTISLLTDRHGQINLDIPVSGSFDDPKFRIWPIIWQVIKNLLTKALTSPFALLASLTGGGEELSFAEFDYGSPAVSDINMKKVGSIVKALKERPQLKMDIEGYVDLENDKEGLRKVEFDRKIKAQKIRETLAKGEAAQQVSLAPEEYEKYLTLAYRAEKFPKPRTAQAAEKKLPKEEMEKLILTNIAVTDSDLRQLASRRAENIKELVLKSGDVAASRIFLIEPKSLAPEKKDKVKDSRVDFKLK